MEFETLFHCANYFYSVTCNSVVNFGFEAGPTGSAIPSWTVALANTRNNAGAVSVVGTDGGIAPKQGSKQVRFTGGGANYSTLKQTVPMCAGTTLLKLSVAAKDDSNNFMNVPQGCTLQLCINNSCNAENTLSGTYGFYDISGSVTSGSSAVISVGVACPSGAHGYVDWVTVG